MSKNPKTTSYSVLKAHASKTAAAGPVRPSPSLPAPTPTHYAHSKTTPQEVLSDEEKHTRLMKEHTRLMDDVKKFKNDFGSGGGRKHRRKSRRRMTNKRRGHKSRKGHKSRRGHKSRKGHKSRRRNTRKGRSHKKR